MSEAFIGWDSFADRQFDPKSSAIQLLGTTKQNVVETVNRMYQERKASAKAGESVLVDGYAPFCKHLFVQNFTQTPTAAVKIDEKNVGLLRTEYKSRRAGELAVLTRWFSSKDVKVSVAKFLDIILYSREQMLKENAATGAATGAATATSAPASEWYIVSVKPQDVAYELPMAPITIMRNALPLGEGGSGKPIDRKRYEKSVEFWKQYANVL